MTSKWTRAGGAGAMLLTAAFAVNIIGAPGGAQTEPVDSITHPGIDTAAVVSDDGNIVVFRSLDVDDVATIQVHNRLAGTTTPLTSEFPADVASPAVSGNGCIVAYIAPGAQADEPLDPPVTDPLVATTPASTEAPVATDPLAQDESADPAATTLPPGDEPLAAQGAALHDAAVQVAAVQVERPPELRIVDRCADLDVSTPLTPIIMTGSVALSQPAVSLDGSVIALSDGQDIYRFARATSGEFDGLEVFDGATVSTPEVLTGDRVDVSDDGSIVVFASGVDLEDQRTLTVHSWINGDVTTVRAGAWAPSLSGDGRVLAYEDPDGVSVMDRTSPGVAPVQLAPGGTTPVISPDGSHVAHVVDDELRIISWTGHGLAPFDVTVSGNVVGAAPPEGRVDFDRSSSVLVSHDDADIVLVRRAAAGAFSSDSFDLGSGDIGVVLETTITFTNDGPASFLIDEPTVEAPFVLGDAACGPSMRPGSTCSFSVSFTVERYEDVFGTVTIPASGLGGEAITTELTALGQPDSVATIPTTTAPGSSSTTGGGSTTTTSSTTGGTTSSTTGGRTTSSTTGGRTTTTTTVPGAGVTFSPTTFDFAPTIVDAGRRTATVEIVNSSTNSVSLVGVRLDPATGPFEIIETTCAGASLGASSRCSVDIAFAPTVEGAQSTKVIAQLAGGVELTANVAGVGAPPPTLTVVPGVATVGQVVTLSGAGFPTGVTVELDWANGVVVSDVVVSDGGTFNVPIVVLPNTPHGPVNASVAGQEDLFSDVSTTMLVTSTSDRSGSSVLEGVGPNVAR